MMFKGMHTARTGLLVVMTAWCFCRTDASAWGQTQSPLKVDTRAFTMEKSGEFLQKPLGDEIPDWKARWELARLLSYVKRYPESVEAYRKVLKEKPEMVAIKSELARVLFWSGQKEHALRLFEQIPPDSFDDEARIILGDLLAYEKQYARSIAMYEDYLKTHPDHYQVRLRMAEVLGWAGRYRDAEAQYRKILDTVPDDIQIRRKYAMVLSWSGRTAEAIDELKKTLP